jgi:hypothetical protein
MKKLTKKQRLLQTQTGYLLIFASIVMLACIVAWYGLTRVVVSTQPQRLVTFYDRGLERSVLTRAMTVQGALLSAGITVDPHDIIEPAVDTTLTKSYVDIIIYRSRPIAVVDGAIRQTVMTSLQSPNEIVKAAGLQALDAKDGTAFQRADWLINSAPTELIVSRTKVEVLPPVVVFQPKSNALTQSKGAQVYVDDNGVAHRETYYDLPMNVVIRACGAAGAYTIRSDGAKVDQDGYVLVAANLAAYPRCTIVDTSMGPGKVYDTGGFAARHPYGFDLATDWSNHDGV